MDFSFLQVAVTYFLQSNLLVRTTFNSSNTLLYRVFPLHFSTQHASSVYLRFRILPFRSTSSPNHHHQQLRGVLVACYESYVVVKCVVVKSVVVRSEVRRSEVRRSEVRRSEVRRSEVRRSEVRRSS